MSTNEVPPPLPPVDIPSLPLVTHAWGEAAEEEAARVTTTVRLPWPGRREVPWRLGLGCVREPRWVGVGAPPPAAGPAPAAPRSCVASDAMGSGG